MDFFDDSVRIGGSDEGLGTGIGFLSEPVDGGLEIGDAVEDAAFEPTRVEPGGADRGMKARVPPEPTTDLGDVRAWRNCPRSDAPRGQPVFRG